jgi:hypothetical protein
MVITEHQGAMMTRKIYASNAALEAMDTEQAAAYIRSGGADFQTAYTKHVAHFFAELYGPADPGPCQPFGPGYVTDLCRCGHERGSHWDGDGSCDPAECGCRIFREQQA